MRSLVLSQFLKSPIYKTKPYATSFATLLVLRSVQVLSIYEACLNVNLNLCCRHYKLEAEIASMTWRVNYRDIVRVPPGKLRGSVYSLVRRSSQCVSIYPWK